MVGYPGNKEAWEIPEGEYLRIYDLFMGGGGFSRAVLKGSPKAKVFGTEANPIQRRLLLAEGARSSILELARKNAETLKLFIDPSWDGQGNHAEQFPHKRESLGMAWGYLVKQPFDEAFRTGQVTTESLAAQLLLSTYGYGANIRTSGNGLNAPPNAQKVRAQTPVFPERLPNLHWIAPSFDQMEIKGGKRTIALIDPPYVVPVRMRKTHKLLTACYPGHEPYGKKTWDLYWKSISKSLGSGVGTAIVSNYFSEEMDRGVRSLAMSYGYAVESIPHGALQTQSSHKHRFKHGGRSAKDDLLSHIDWEWRLRKIERTIVSVGQLELLAG